VSNKLKAIVAALASLLAIVNTVVQHYQPPAGTESVALDWRTIAAQIAIPLLVYFVPNLPKGWQQLLPLLTGERPPAVGSTLLPSQSGRTVTEIPDN
jgi:hypothetical protein